MLSLSSLSSLSLLLSLLLILNYSNSFKYQFKHQHQHSSIISSSSSLISSSSFTTTSLYAGFGSTKGKSKPNNGNIDVDDCPCRSGLKYSQCCGELHSKTSIAIVPSKVVMARYTAYKIDNPNYIIETTSPTCSDYEFYVLTAQGNGMNAWVRAIRRDMIDTYAYVKQQIVSEEIETIDGVPRSAKVVSRLLAISKVENVMYPVEDENTLVYLNGQWLFEKSDVRRPPPEVAAQMMQDWPEQEGMSLKSIEDEKLRDDDEAASANPLDKVPLNKMTRGGMRTYGGGIDKVQRRR